MKPMDIKRKMLAAGSLGVMLSTVLVPGVSLAREAESRGRHSENEVRGTSSENEVRGRHSENELRGRQNEVEVHQHRQRGRRPAIMVNGVLFRRP